MNIIYNEVIVRNKTIHYIINIKKPSAHWIHAKIPPGNKS